MKSKLGIFCSIVFVLFLFGFCIAMMRGVQRDDLQFAIGNDPMCIGADVYIQRPGVYGYKSDMEKYYNQSIIDRVLGTLYFVKNTYLYFNDLLFVSLLFCQKDSIYALPVK